MSANNILPAVEYRDMILDEYKKESISAKLDGDTKDLGSVLSPNEIKLKTIKTTSLGNYVRDQGHAAGQATIGWETIKLEIDRGVKFLLDRVDSIETLSTAITDLSKDFTDRQMVPEFDAFRFAKYATNAGTTTNATLNENTILSAIDAAMLEMNNAYVPAEGRLLFVNGNLMPIINKAIPRQWSNEAGINRSIQIYNGLEIVYVPDVRFNSSITLNPTSGDMGFTPDGNSINFLLLHPTAIWQAVKVSVPKYLSADDAANPVDSHIFNIRIFHDAGVYKLREKGVYANIAA